MRGFGKVPESHTLRASGGEVYHDGNRIRIVMGYDGTVIIGCTSTNLKTMEHLIAKWHEAFPEKTEVVIQP